MIFLKTLIFAVPENSARKSGEYDDFPNEFGLIRVIYARPGIKGVRRILLSRSVRKLTENAVIFGGEAPVNIKGEKFYRNGNELALFYINQIIKYLKDGEGGEIVIFSKDINDCTALSETITSFDVKILTLPSLVLEYSDYLSREFGIVNGASAAQPLSGKTVLIMGGCESFQVSGAKEIVNLSGKEISVPSATPESVCLAPPEKLKCKALFLRRCDFLQTALDFFGISYENISLLSVKCAVKEKSGNSI